MTKYFALVDMGPGVESEMLTADAASDREGWEKLVAARPPGTSIVAFSKRTVDDFDNPAVRQIDMRGLTQ